MKAMIFAAGLGTRLKPLTHDKPKALVEINGTPLLEIVIERLKQFGFTDIIINIHHKAQQIIDFTKTKNNFHINIAFSDESDKLLDTGGGLKKADWFFNDDEAFLLCNVDILSDIDLKALYQYHKNADALVTLAVNNSKNSRSLLFNENNHLKGWMNHETGETKPPRSDTGSLSPLTFSGIHVISPRIFGLIEEEGAFSVIDLYLRLAQKHVISGFRHDSKHWLDVGTHENLEKAMSIIKQVYLKS